MGECFDLIVLHVSIWQALSCWVFFYAAPISTHSLRFFRKIINAFSIDNLLFSSWLFFPFKFPYVYFILAEGRGIRQHFFYPNSYSLFSLHFQVQPVSTLSVLCVRKCLYLALILGCKWLTVIPSQTKAFFLIFQLRSYWWGSVKSEWPLFLGWEFSGTFSDFFFYSCKMILDIGCIVCQCLEQNSQEI